MSKPTQPTAHSDSEQNDEIVGLYILARSATLREPTMPEFRKRLLQWADRRAEKLVVEALETLDDKLYDLNEYDWGIPTKWSKEKFGGEQYADIWTPNSAIHECVRDHIATITATKGEES